MEQLPRDLTKPCNKASRLVDEAMYMYSLKLFVETGSVVLYTDPDQS